MIEREQLGENLLNFGLDRSLCALCQISPNLVESHFIPAFVYRWIKETSATGFLRGGFAPEKRLQDGFKAPLLCSGCEQKFSDWERLFSERAFYPYVNIELSDEGIAQSKVKSFRYEEWLLQFCVSLQWRCLLLPDTDGPLLSKKQTTELREVFRVWRDFLLRKRNDTGPWRHYLVFLQNLGAASGPGFPHNLPTNANLYGLRAIDTTPVFGSKQLSLYTKLGPMFFWTSIIPSENKKMSRCRIQKKGVHETATSIVNPRIGSFIVVTRPTEIGGVMGESSKVQKRVERAFLRNPDKVKNSMTNAALLGDVLLQARKLPSPKK